MTLLDIKPGVTVIDGTLDGGGYATAILDRITPGGTLLGIDLDAGMVTAAEEKLAPYRVRGATIKLAAGTYADVEAIAAKEGIRSADGFVLDLGFSSEQLERSGKGFSFSKDEPLLMTYRDGDEPARDALKRLSEKELADLLYQLSGERYSRRIARAIKKTRRPIATSGELANVVAAAVPKSYERGRLHPATRTFMALRMFVNHELEHLERALAAAPKILIHGGRCVVVSFHSLEDRVVKHAFSAYVKSGVATALTKKPIVASLAERRTNPRARSAKLRAVTFA